MLYRRDRGAKEKLEVRWENLPAVVSETLREIQQNLFNQAKEYREQHLVTNISTLEEFKRFFTPKNKDKPEIHGGFVRAKWCEDPKSVEQLADLKVTVRCLPLDQSGSPGTCVLTGRPATTEAIFGKAY